MIAAYSPEARGRSERMFRTHQDRLVKELAAAGFTEMAAANRYRCHYVKATVRIQRYPDGSLALFHGPRKLTDYHPNGSLNNRGKEIAA